MNQKKREHIELAIKSQTGLIMNDNRFDYEPLLSAHPENDFKPFDFLGKKMKVPLWISSMTGGSEYSGVINKNLARACNEFGLGMGLGSCRVIYEDGKYFEHFNLRPIIGEQSPFYANLGIVQIERALTKKDTGKIFELVDKLQADGLIIHVNPLQEWLQPEGEKLTRPPVDTLQEFLSLSPVRLIVKEVGQGLGPESLKKLLELPLEAIELAAYGGTNFARVELKRSNQIKQELLEPLTFIGNDASQMIETINKIYSSGKISIKCRSIIISGGISNFLDGYYYMKKCKLNSIYGQASKLLTYAREDYSQLKEYIQFQISGLLLAKSYLRLKENSGI